ncbi:SHOCT domain-containing protein [Acholeplasma sp. OttesenSCG-928-E16]|nr:SHOCT domain-containing protein [Acholeplasma sp. OttesenSCG-928-E16]
MVKTIELRASKKNLNAHLQAYEGSGWKILSVVRGSGWLRVLNTYPWVVTMSKDENEEVNSSVTDELIKAKELLDSNAITKEEYEVLKKKIIS